MEDSDNHEKLLHCTQKLLKELGNPPLSIPLPKPKVS